MIRTAKVFERSTSGIRTEFKSLFLGNTSSMCHYTPVDLLFLKQKKPGKKEKASCLPFFLIKQVCISKKIYIFAVKKEYEKPSLSVVPIAIETFF